LPPWWATWWAYTLYALLFAATVFFITGSYQRRLFYKEQQRNKLLELEMQALRAQMNPHFIFNCLSSINGFILMNETKPASDYLTKFSRLIRTVLNNSKKSLISLEDELEMLKLYLDMENLRFNNGFDYNIHVDDNVDAQTVFIPPLLFQPFAENAVWHGLMHKGERGKLQISLSIETNVLKFVIEDNGIGRAAAASLHTKSAEKNKSLGLQITKERLSLINGYADEKTFFEIDDLYDNTGSAAGTRVLIKINFSETAQ
jgi:sensor histidine kinase YesM